MTGESTHGRRCTICAHADRAPIELGLANNVPVRMLAKRHGISKEAAFRHRKNHMPTQLLAKLKTRGRSTEIDLEQLRITESEGLLQHLVAQRARLYCLADDAEDLKDIGNAARVHGQLTRNLELTGKLLGDLQTGNQTITQNILIAPQYHTMRTEMIRALRPYPDAQRAVVAVLQAMEAPAIQGEVAHA